MGTKITVIGAGSAVFSLSIIKDVCLTPRLKNSLICLMDIDENRLDAAYLLCVRYAEEIGIKLDIEKTTDRRKALDNADFVVTTALVIGHHKMSEGWDIAKKHGYRFGGSLHIMHDEAFWVNFYQLKLIESIYQDILKICPSAWYIVVANPVMAAITYIGRKYPGAKIVGLCQGSTAIYQWIKLLGLEKEHVTFEMPGVNHFIWLTKFFYKGKDAFGLLDDWIREKSNEYLKTCHISSNIGQKAIDLYKRFGVLPLGDTVNPGGGSWGYWYHSDSETEKRWNEDPTQVWHNYFIGCDRRIEKIARVAYDKDVKLTEIFPPKRSNEVVIDLIESLFCDIEKIFTVNILNNAQYVPGVPANFQVEIPALCGKKGIQGIHTDGLPKAIMSHLFRDRIAPVEIELEAYEKKDWNLLLSLIMMDPWTKSELQATNLLNDIMELPYNEDMRKHYTK